MTLNQIVVKQLQILLMLITFYIIMALNCTTSKQLGVMLYQNDSESYHFKADE